MKQCPMSRSVTQNDALDFKMSRKCHVCHRMDIVQNRAPRLRFVRDFFQNKGHSQERTLVQNLRTVSAKHARVLVMPGPTHSKDLHDLYTNPPRKSPCEGHTLSVQDSLQGIHTLFVQWPCTQRLYNYNRVWFFPTSKASAVLPRERSSTHHVQKNAAIEGPPRTIGFCEQAVSRHDLLLRPAPHNIETNNTRRNITLATRDFKKNLKPC